MPAYEWSAETEDGTIRATVCRSVEDRDIPPDTHYQWRRIIGPVAIGSVPGAGDSPPRPLPSVIRK